MAELFRRHGGAAPCPQPPDRGTGPGDRPATDWERPPVRDAPEVPPGGGTGSRRRGLSPPLRFLLKLTLLAALLAAVFTLVLGVHIQRGSRMYPFIMDGDLVIVYRLERARVGDAALYRSPWTGQPALSRVVAIGENEIDVTESGLLLINGASPPEQVFYPTLPLEDGALAYPYTMDADSVFLLDGYRTVGRDSRLFGAVPEEALLGKAVYVFRRRGI